MPVRKLLIIAFLSFSVSTCCGQSKENIIKDIRASFQKTDHDHTLKKVALENEEFIPRMTDGGSSLTGYFKGDTIYKIHEWVGLSVCVRQYHYYFSKNKLIFIYETEEDFPADDKTGTLDQSKLIPAFEGRYYLKDGRVVKIKTKGAKRMDKLPTPKYVKGLIPDVSSYTKLLRSRLGKVKR